MITIISPAKSMDFESKVQVTNSSEPKNKKITDQLISIMQKYKVEDIANLMKVSDKIAELNFERFQDYDNLPDRQALFAYNGDVYNNIDKNTLSLKNIEFAQKNLRIISGLYGALRPLDLIRPYRLEMATKIAEIAPKGLNKFWQQDVTECIKQELILHEEQFLINLASAEYMDAVDQKILDYPVINIHFRENRDGALRNIAINAKRARGMMADFIIRNQIEKPEQLKDFDISSYKYNTAMSNEYNMFFIK